MLVVYTAQLLLKRHKEEYDKEKKIFASIDGYLEAQNEYQSQIADLEAKLTEKEKEIEIVKHERNANGASYMSACKMLTKERQDKISFAVEKLEQVREEILPEISFDVQKEFVKKEIDNQIKQLKEMK